MRCYVCKAELSEHDFCTNCGADVKIYKRLMWTSNYFYNVGLEKAKIRDLSGAEKNLRESLRFNKNNIKARNLLGLIYFEKGDVVSAMVEWVISKNLKPKKNVAAEYMNILEENGPKLENMNQAIKKYNLALEYCYRNSTDLAVIQLKKVISLNPKLLVARQLLALIFINAKKAEPARRELEKCKEIDVTNTLTLRYLKEVEALINPDDDKNKKNQESEISSDVVTFVRDNELIIQPNGVKEKKGSAAVLNILVGIALGFAIAFFLVLPTRIQNEKSAAQEEIKNIGAQLDAKNLTISELEGQISDQNEKIKSLSESLETYAGTEGTLLSMENLLKASAMYLQNPENVLDVADYITAVDESSWTEGTSENYKALYYALKAAIGPQVCYLYNEDGATAYRDKQYTDALAYYSNGYFFDPENAESLYMLANCYMQLEKNEEALLNFKQVVDKFPGTDFAIRAQRYINTLEEEAPTTE